MCSGGRGIAGAIPRISQDSSRDFLSLTKLFQRTVSGAPTLPGKGRGTAGFGVPQVFPDTVDLGIDSGPCFHFPLIYEGLSSSL